MGETARNLNKRIYEHKKDFKSGNKTNFLVWNNILANNTFDFHNSTIFAFIHDRDKHWIIKASSITYFDTIIQRQGFYRISPSLVKMIQKDFDIHLLH